MLRNFIRRFFLVSFFPFWLGYSFSLGLPLVGFLIHLFSVCLIYFIFWWFYVE